MVTKSKQTPNLASPNRHVPLHRPPGKSLYPGPHLAGFFPGSSRLSLRTDPRHPWFPLPPHRPRTSGGRAAPAKQSESRHRAHRGFSFPQATSAQARGVSGALHLRRVWSQARRGRTAALLASESPDSRLPHKNQRAASKSVLRLSEGLRGCSTPVFLPGESQRRGSLVGCRLWGRTESDTTEAT